MNTPRPGRPAKTSAARIGTDPPGDARRWQLQEILVPSAAGGLSIADVGWQHKSH